MRHLLTLLSIFTFLTTLHAQVPSYVPTDGLVGWWPFNGNANDESGNGNNGVVNGATLTSDRQGSVFKAFSFDGSNYISVDGIDFESEFTIQIWYQLNDYNMFSSMCYWGLEGFGNNYTRSCDIGTDNLNFNPTLTRANLNYNFGYAGVFTNDNNWNQICATLQNNELKLFFNAQLVQTSFTQKEFLKIVSSDVSRIGSGNNAQGNPVNYFIGSLDDVGLWNRALTPTEIQALYTAQPLTPCVSPDPVSFTGLGSSYTLADAPVTLSGTPAGGVFIGPGVSGSTFDPAAAGVGTHSVTYTYVDGNNCINTAGQCTEVTVNAGIGGSNMTTGGVRVFPNPNRGQFTVELELAGLVGLQVFDARGALVHNEVFTASGSRTQRTLDLSAFAKGSYTLQVEHDGQRVSQTVVVE
jgi:hypothetical protein